MQFALGLKGVLLGVLAAAPIVAIAMAGFAGPSDVAIEVQPSSRFQTMTGWEVTARMWEEDKKNDRYDGSWLLHRDEIAEGLAAAGIDRIRLEVRSGSENPVDYWALFAGGQIGYRDFQSHRYEKINDNADPRQTDPQGFKFSELDYRVETMLLPLKAAVERRGRRLVVNLCYSDFKWSALKGDLSHADAPDEYAELIVATFDRLRTKYGLSPDYFEVVLEADNTDRWRGAQVGAGVVTVARRLAQAGYRPKLIAPSTAHAAQAAPYIDQALRVSGAGRAISVLSYHRYDPPGRADAALDAIRARAARHHWQTAMLEHVDGDVSELMRDLSLADASSWQQWAAASRLEPNGQPRRGWLLAADLNGSPGSGSIRLTSVSAALSRVFTNVDVGAVRIGAVAKGPDVQVVAFENPDGGAAVVAKLGRPGTVRFSNLPPGRYEVSLATPDGRVVGLSDVQTAAGGTAKVAVSDPGVLALVSRGPRIPALARAARAAPDRAAQSAGSGSSPGR